MALKRVWIPSPNYSQPRRLGRAPGGRAHGRGRAQLPRPGQLLRGRGSRRQLAHRDRRRARRDRRVRPPWRQGVDGRRTTTRRLSRSSCAPRRSATTHACGANWWRGRVGSPHNMLANVADWIREECQHYGLPIEKLSASAAQGSGRGVCVARRPRRRRRRALGSGAELPVVAGHGHGSRRLGRHTIDTGG